jgi:hypothetical protein
LQGVELNLYYLFHHGSTVRLVEIYGVKLYSFQFASCAEARIRAYIYSLLYYQPRGG